MGIRIMVLVAIVGADMLTAEQTPLMQDKTWPEVQKARRGLFWIGRRVFAVRRD